MTPEFVISVGREAMQVAFLLAAPPLVTALVVGLVVSIFQAVTQIQEMTLAIIPKMVAILIALIVAFPWLLETLTAYTTTVFQSIPIVLR
ncbi:MAG: flagellar biosynthesis protein FliQ [SAR324 cluster bacterium]|nr:flagellar biosynthesis protein FliQ [SAR324 cluster bacterium]MCZ6532309.1 flagellar biosynthesis protein FliQ [SAR324 cluster bacterium]MCZ6556463.1 flagellar biosynthesis protein FliQ [SAR324 cluster bacterium]MCZ6628494.1 flagellar biosynthesis protein FliQ [SAR324 cluster bacterium]MCZ6647290.1 flagellar biosynthesis protein FliQ [SAR324 cluster bacterium]